MALNEVFSSRPSLMVPRGAVCGAIAGRESANARRTPLRDADLARSLAIRGPRRIDAHAGIGGRYGSVPAVSEMSRAALSGLQVGSLRYEGTSGAPDLRGRLRAFRARRRRTFSGEVVSWIGHRLDERLQLDALAWLAAVAVIRFGWARARRCCCRRCPPTATRTRR
jgi:hypothetical protein